MGHLGTHKDLEKLARRARKLGWDVRVTNSNHIRWTPPGEGVTPIMSGLTMNSGGVARTKLTLKKAGLE